MGKHLDFYFKCMESGELPYAGLCYCAARRLISKKLLDIIEPSFEDDFNLRNEGLSFGYWSSGLLLNDSNKFFQFTPLRQTIVLFMAAMNNEL